MTRLSVIQLRDGRECFGDVDASDSDPGINDANNDRLASIAVGINSDLAFGWERAVARRSTGRCSGKRCPEAFSF